MYQRLFDRFWNGYLQGSEFPLWYRRVKYRWRAAPVPDGWLGWNGTRQGNVSLVDSEMRT